jgi:putative ABC transport system permease protein
MSLILIIGTIIVRSQLHYIQTKNLGFQKDHVINVTLYDRALRMNVENLKAEFLKNPRIISASGNYFMSGGGNNSIDWEGRKDGEEKMMRFFSVDADFLNTFEIELKEGRNFRKGSPSDLKQAYLLNESAVKELGWESAVGKDFEVQMSGSEMGQVIGVVKDFHFQSLKEPMRPLALRFAE